MKLIKHPNVVGLHEVTRHNFSIYLILVVSYFSWKNLLFTAACPRCFIVACIWTAIAEGFEPTRWFYFHKRNFGKYVQAEWCFYRVIRHQRFIFIYLFPFYLWNLAKLLSPGGSDYILACWDFLLLFFSRGIFFRKLDLRDNCLSNLLSPLNTKETTLFGNHSSSAHSFSLLFETCSVVDRFLKVDFSFCSNLFLEVSFSFACLSSHCT